MIDPGSPAAPVELFLFAVDKGLVVEATSAGIDGFIVDWERRGKYRRQAGEATQINRDTPEDLATVRQATSRRVICRINGYGKWTASEVETAVDHGADELLLPMVRSTEEVDRLLELADSRVEVGVLVETQEGVRLARSLASRPLSRIYLGLNDLRIDRGSDQLFAPLVDGTAELVAQEVRANGSSAGTQSFGVAGLTLPDRGAPVPSHLLAAELVRLQASFTFLRRSFLADTRGENLGPAVSSIRSNLHKLTERSAIQSLADHAELVGLVSSHARKLA